MKLRRHGLLLADQPCFCDRRPAVEIRGGVRRSIGPYTARTSVPQTAEPSMQRWAFNFGRVVGSTMARRARREAASTPRFRSCRSAKQVSRVLCIVLGACAECGESVGRVGWLAPGGPPLAGACTGALLSGLPGWGRRRDSRGLEAYSGVCGPGLAADATSADG